MNAITLNPERVACAGLIVIAWAWMWVLTQTERRDVGFSGTGDVGEADLLSESVLRRRSSTAAAKVPRLCRVVVWIL
jgi:hypothetical protein